MAKILFNKRHSTGQWSLLKKLSAVMMVAFIILSVVGGSDTRYAYATSGLITNDAFKLDTSGNPIYSQGGGIFKFGNTYYWYGVKYNGAVTYYNNPTAKNSDSSFAAVTCYTSTDLVNWTFANNILTSSTAGLTNTSWVGRGGVAYCPTSGKYVFMCQIGYTDGTGGELFATCDTPSGNYTFNNVQATIPNMLNGMTGDQTVFTDTDGQSYLCASSTSGRARTYICTLRASDYCQVTNSTQIFGGVGREGNCMFKYNGRYYVCSSDLHGWNASHCYVISSTSLMSGYSAETVMTGTEDSFCHVSQTGFFVTVSGTSGSFVLYCGDRWSDFAGNGLGYHVWCPISFSGTTPIFNDLSAWNLDAAAGTWSVATTNNYVKNANFEADRVIMTDPAGWSIWDNMPSSECNTSVSGKRSYGNFFWSHYNAAAYSASTYQTITGLANGTYTLTCYARSGGGQSICQLFAKNFGGTEIDAAITGSSWTKITINNIVVTNGQCQIGVYSVASAGQWVNFDDFTLTKN